MIGFSEEECIQFLDLDADQQHEVGTPERENRAVSTSILFPVGGIAICILYFVLFVFYYTLAHVRRVIYIKICLQCFFL